jgi:hypothetical protein
MANRNRVDETAAGKQIAAYVILDKKGAYVGKCLVHHGNGRTIVNLWDWTNREQSNYQEGIAKGYGYDRFTSALDGLTFGGVELHDHCDQTDASRRAMAQYKRLPLDVRTTYAHPQLQAFGKRWARRGVDFSNYSQSSGYGSAYMIPGLKRLEAMGYQVIQAI